MDDFGVKITSRNAQYRAKLETDPALKERREKATAHECPKWKLRAEKSCTVVLGGECRWLIKPPQWVCERCWERMQDRTKEE